jgi:hypothetical protein
MEELPSEPRHEGKGIGELLMEKRTQPRRVAERRETRVSFLRQEQGGREAAAEVGKSDQHMIAARPDMQGVGFHPEALIFARGDAQFLVAMGERFLLAKARGRLEDGLTDPRLYAVTADDPIEVDLKFLGVIPQAQPVAFKISALAGVIETDRDPAGRLGGLHEERGEPAARHRVDHLVGFVPVGLEPRGSAFGVDHASAHGDQERLDTVH